MPPRAEKTRPRTSHFRQPMRNPTRLNAGAERPRPEDDPPRGGIVRQATAPVNENRGFRLPPGEFECAVRTCGPGDLPDVSDVGHNVVFRAWPTAVLTVAGGCVMQVMRHAHLRFPDPTGCHFGETAGRDERPGDSDSVIAVTPRKLVSAGG